MFRNHTNEIGQEMPARTIVIAVVRQQPGRFHCIDLARSPCRQVTDYLTEDYTFTNEPAVATPCYWISVAVLNWNWPIPSAWPRS